MITYTVLFAGEKIPEETPAPEEDSQAGEMGGDAGTTESGGEAESSGTDAERNGESPTESEPMSAKDWLTLAGGLGGFIALVAVIYLEKRAKRKDEKTEK